MVLDGALRLKSGRLGIEDWVAGGVALISGLVGADDAAADGRKAWFAMGAGESLREISKRFDVSAGGTEMADALGVSADAGFGCWALELLSSLNEFSVILASSISPSSTSSFPEAVLTIFGAPFTLELCVSTPR